MRKRAAGYEETGGWRETELQSRSPERPVMRKRAYLITGHDMSCDSAPLIIRKGA
jgi:hypothetical protein